VTTPPERTRDAAGPHVAAVADDAEHGSYCPKMCTHACPVVSATGRDDAVPWGFHRTVSDLASGRLPLVPAVADRLTACTGCLACRVPCAFDQDVPAQVRAGRAALVDAEVAPLAVTAAIDHVASGRTPEGQLPLDPPAVPAVAGDAPRVHLVVGCRDDAQELADTVAVLAAAGDRVEVAVPAGCCGALLDDLGATDAAATARSRLAGPAEGATVVATDPHCLPALRAAGLAATDLTSHLDRALTEGRLVLARGDAFAATWHDPCLLARGEGVTAAPRRLLTAVGAQLTEPEHHGERTSCSGAGLGFDVLDPVAADAVAGARVRELGPGTVVTGCARARQRLAAAGADVRDLAGTLRDHLAAPTDDRSPS
jgi:Fe-S oxidoreductase